MFDINPRGDGVQLTSTNHIFLKRNKGKLLCRSFQLEHNIHQGNEALNKRQKNDK